MISTNQSSVSGRLPTNERGPLCHLAQPEHDGPLVLRHHRQAEDPGDGEQGQADQPGDEGQEGGHQVRVFIRLLVSRATTVINY